MLLRVPYRYYDDQHYTTTRLPRCLSWGVRSCDKYYRPVCSACIPLARSGVMGSTDLLPLVWNYFTCLIFRCHADFPPLRTLCTINAPSYPVELCFDYSA